MHKPVSPKRLAANRQNAARSTGPRTPEGKIRSSQNARKYSFTPEAFAVIRLESPELVRNLRADAIATYHPLNSQETFAVERIVVAQVSLLRMAALEAGMFTSCLEEAMEGPAKPYIFQNPEVSQGIEIATAQHRAYWAATGYRRVVRMQPLALSLFLRQHAQAERFYRRAVEDFDRLRSLRSELPPENHDLPENEPTAPSQPMENTGQTVENENRQSNPIAPPHKPKSHPEIIPPPIPLDSNRKLQ